MDDSRETAMSLKDGGKLSINFMYLLTSIQKSIYSEMISAYGVQWDTVVNENTGETFGNFLYDQVIKSAKSALVCEYMHDKVYSLSLTDKQKESVDAQIDTLISKAGSKKNFEEQLSMYSCDLKTFKRYLEISLKQSNLYTCFYDTDGIFAISEDKVQSEFEQKYAIVTHIYFNTATKTKPDGSLVSMTDEEKAQKKSLAQTVYSSILAGESFEELKTHYSEDAYESIYYPNGFFVTGDTTFPSEFTSAALEMKEGEIRFVQTESAGGIHIMKKLPMDSSLYNSNESVYNTIMSNLITSDFDTRLQEYFDDVSVNSELMDMLDVSIVPEYQY